MGEKGGSKEKDESKEEKREKQSSICHKTLMETWKKYQHFPIKKKRSF